MSRDLNLLMSHAEDGGPVDGVDEGASHSQGNVEPELPTHLWDDSAAPDDLPRQRWGVIVPHGPEGERLRAAIQPLIDWRRDQQGAEVEVISLPPGMDRKAAEKWRENEFHSQADLDFDVPRYVAILGDFDQISLEVQQVLATHRGFPGRICFDELEQYEGYCQKVKDWETAAQSTSHSRADALLYTAHDGTSATRVGHKALMAPGLEVLRRRAEMGQLPHGRLQANEDLGADPDELFDLVQGSAPGVLFSMSHGDGPPKKGWRSRAAQLAGQGAMSFGTNDSLRASDFAEAPFLPGGIWFMLACFGAGTPRESSYQRWLQQLEDVGDFSGAATVADALDASGPGFVAALPKAALANPNGPLAFMGHVDLAWTYGFQDAEERDLKRPARYMGIVRSLLEGHRAGVALNELYRHVGTVNSTLSVLYDEDAKAAHAGSAPDPQASRRGHLWMVRQDLQAYVLMGDPAVSLPLRRAQPQRARSRGSSSSSGQQEHTWTMEAWEVEEHLGAFLAGDSSWKQLSKALGMGLKETKKAMRAYQQAGRRAVGLPDD